ncbi:class I SAM-dependent methyltransferase [Candidatus Fermentibacteria bacterium]|nr:class I SAM-dependent methyltransferase [Candidatus Fermentibacteria bacterium]
MNHLQRDVISFYSDPTTAAAFHDDRYGGAIGEFFLREEVHSFRVVAGRLPPETVVLDLGAGTGKLIGAFDIGSRHVGMDRSLQMLRALKTRHPSIPLVVGDAHALPFRSRSVDVVTASRLLMHLTEWRRMVCESCRVARQNVLLDFPVSPSLAALEPRFWGIIRRDAHPPHRVFTRREVRGAFAAVGFTEVRARHGFVLPYRLHRKLGRPWLSRALERIMRGVGLAYLIGSPAVVAFSSAPMSDTPT